MFCFVFYFAKNNYGTYSIMAPVADLKSPVVICDFKWKTKIWSLKKTKNGSQRERKLQTLVKTRGGGRWYRLCHHHYTAHKIDPLLVKATGHNSPRRFRSGAVSVPSSSFTHSITVGCSGRAGGRSSERGLARCRLEPWWSWSSASPINFFALLWSRSVGLHYESPPCLFKESKNWGSSTQETAGTWPFTRVLSCYTTHFTSSA